MFNCTKSHSKKQSTLKLKWETWYIMGFQSKFLHENCAIIVQRYSDASNKNCTKIQYNLRWCAKVICSNPERNLDFFRILLFPAVLRIYKFLRIRAIDKDFIWFLSVAGGKCIKKPLTAIWGQIKRIWVAA